MLIDGIPVNDPGGYAPDLYDVDWKTVKNVEIIKGLAASMYGGSANGGVINIITKNGGEKPVNSTFYGSAGSYGFWKTLAQVDGTDDKVNYRFSYSHNQGNGYRQHQAFMGDNFSEKLNWVPSEKVKITQLITYTDYFNQNSEGMNLYRIKNFGTTAANTDAIPYNEFQETQRITGASIGKFEISKKQDLQVKGFFRLTEYKEQSNGGVDYKPYVNPGFSAQYDLKSGKENLLNNMSLGTDIESQTTTEHEFGVPDEDHINHDRQDSHFGETTFDNNQVEINQLINQRSAGLFFIEKLDISKRLFATLNVRYDYVYNRLVDNKTYQTPDSSGSGQKVFQKPTFRFGVTYDWSKFLNVYVNYGTGFLPPTNDELYNNPVHWGGFNSAIKPSTSYGEELGIRGAAGKTLYYNITGFTMKTMNEFYRYREAWMGNTSDVYGNIGATKKQGLEAYLSYTPVEDFIFDLAYTYSHFRYSSPDSVKNQWIPECPQHILVAELSYKFLRNFTLSLNTEYQSKWYINSDPRIYNTYTLGATSYQPAITYNSWVPGFNIYNAEISDDWKIGVFRGNISLFIKNIFDRHYYGFTEPDNPPDYNCYQPAPGKEFFVNIKICF